MNTHTSEISRRSSRGLCVGAAATRGAPEEATILRRRALDVAVAVVAGGRETAAAAVVGGARPVRRRLEYMQRRLLAVDLQQAQDGFRAGRGIGLWADSGVGAAALWNCEITDFRMASRLLLRRSGGADVSLSYSNGVPRVACRARMLVRSPRGGGRAHAPTGRRTHHLSRGLRP
jgi:hypothetical protein